MMEEGALDPALLARVALGYMSEDEVRDMAESNELILDEEDDDEDEEAEEEDFAAGAIVEVGQKTIAIGNPFGLDHADAIRLMKAAFELKQAEREKDFASVAEVLERCVDVVGALLAQPYVGAADWAGLEALDGSQGDWEGLVDFQDFEAGADVEPEELDFE